MLSEVGTKETIGEPVKQEFVSRPHVIRAHYERVEPHEGRSPHGLLFDVKPGPDEKVAGVTGTPAAHHRARERL